MKKKIIIILSVLLRFCSLSATVFKADEQPIIERKMASDYQHLNLRTEAEEAKEAYYTVNGEKIEAEYSYDDAWQAYMEMPDEWFDKDLTIELFVSDEKVAETTTNLPALPVTKPTPPMEAVIAVSEETELVFHPQQGRTRLYYFFPAGTDLSNIIFRYGETVTDVTVKSPFNDTEAITLTSDTPADLTSLLGAVSCGADFVEFNYKVSGNAEKAIVGIMVSKNVESVFFTSKDPVNKGRAYIESDPDHNRKAAGSLQMFNSELKEEYSGAVSAIKGRGNTTWGGFNPKKPYQIKLDKKADLLDPKDGKQKAKTWLLLSEPFDYTQLHNSVSYDFAYLMGLTNTPEGKTIDLYYDGEYRGSYYLCEKNEIGEGRVEINDLEKDIEDANPDVDFEELPVVMTKNKYGRDVQYVDGITDPEDITGGYLLEIDHVFYESEKSWFVARSPRFVSKQPEYLSKTAMEYISDFMENVMSYVYDGKTNLKNVKNIFDVIDRDSFVRYFMLMQLNKNNDTYTSSTFVYKPENEDKLYAGPVWDCDTSLGVRVETETDRINPEDDSYSPEGWLVRGLGKKLLENADFQKAIYEYYNKEMRSLIDEIIFSKDTADTWYQKAKWIEQSVDMNYTLHEFNTATGIMLTRDCYWQNITYMFNWIKERVDWLDRALLTPDINRLYGNNRYDTAIKIAEKLKTLRDVTSFDTFILADGQNFPDALCSAYLANSLNAPIMLINDKNAAKVTEYINANITENGKVLVLGGVNAVSEDLLKPIKAETTRISGATRYETNMQILDAIEGEITDLLVCTGNSYADSLSASAVDIPILLVKDTLTDQQTEYLEKANLENIYIIGGTRAVNSNVEKRLRKYCKVTRVFGANRFETSLNVAREFFEDADNAVVSYSHNFPDGLCGGTLANALGSPVLLGRTNDTILVKPFFTENAILKTTVLGGERLIDNNSVLKLFDTIIKPTIKVNK